MKIQKKKFIAFFTGLSITIILLEVMLRIIGFININRVTSDKKLLSSSQQTNYTILFLGDSFTAGMGASHDKTMPTQLQNLFNSEFKENFVNVINGGMPGCNTTQVLNKLDYAIGAIKPDLIILLIGGANKWNHKGYYAYLKGKSLFAALKDQVYRIRVYKLAKLLFFDIPRFSFLY